MSSNALVGMAVTAHNNTRTCIATFASVSVNQAPLLAAISDQTILAGRTLGVNSLASDADVPAQTLTYSLLNSPLNATIGSNTGVFTWRPAISQSLSTQSVGVIVSDNGLSSMAATQYFTAIVNRPAQTTVSGFSVTNGQCGFLVSGDAGPDYLILNSTNLSSWTAIATSAPPVLPFWWSTTNRVQFPSQFYRVKLGPE